MKKFLDGMKIGLGFISIFAVFLIIGFYIVKARNGTTASPGDKLTSSKRNELVNQINTLSGNVSTYNQKIICEKIISYNITCPGDNARIYTGFTASECGGTLPNNDYIGYLNRIGTVGGVKGYGLKTSSTGSDLYLLCSAAGTINVWVKGIFVKK